MSIFKKSFIFGATAIAICVFSSFKINSSNVVAHSENVYNFSYSKNAFLCQNGGDM